MRLSKEKRANKMRLNNKTAGTELFEVLITLKGSKEITSVYVYAKNRLEASNQLILNKIYGKQHEIRYHSSNLLK